MSVTPFAVSLPMFFAVTTYSMMSPGETRPPLRSVATVTGRIFGASSCEAIVSTPGKIASPVLLTVALAEVAPLARIPSAFSMSMSTPRWLRTAGSLPVSTRAPRTLTEELKKSVAGLTASLSVVPWSLKESPPMPMSPS